VDLLGEPCLWCWEIVDPGDGALIESSWATEWTGYGSSPEAWRAGILRLTELTRPSRRARLRGRRPPAGGPENTTVVVARDAGELYTSLKSTFADSDRIEVIRDRRFGERRHRDEAVRFDRRRGDRRARPPVHPHVGSNVPVALVTPSTDPS
jgi:hypothetical protein